MTDGGFQIIGNAGKTIIMAAGTSLTLGTAATARLFPTLYINANINLDIASTIIFNSNAATNISGVPNYGNLTLSATANVTKTALAAINVNGTLNIGQYNTFADGGFTITAKGNVTNNGTHSGAGKLYLNSGSAAHTLTGAGAYGNLELNDIQGANQASNSNIDGNFTLTSGEWNTGNFNMTLAKNWNNTGGTFTQGTGIVSFDGSIAQTIQNGQSFTFLNINNSSTGVTISSNITVTDQLTFTTGLINTGANRVIVTSTATNNITGSSITGYINGNLRQYVVNATEYYLPVGTAAHYEWAKIDFTSIAGINYIDVYFTVNNENPVPGGLTVNGQTIDFFLNYGYWTVTPDAGTGTYNISCQSKGHADLGGTEDNYTLITNLGGGGYLSNGIHSNTTQYYTTTLVTARRSALSAFGRYVVGHSATVLYTPPAVTTELLNKSVKIKQAAGSNLYVIGAATHLNNNSGGTITTNTGATLSVGGNLNNAASTVLMNDGTVLVTGNLNNTAAGTFTHTAGTVSITTDLSNDASTYSQAAGTLNVTGNVTNSNSALIEIIGTANITGNTINNSTSTISVDGTYKIKGNWTNNAEQSVAYAGATLGTIEFNGTAAQIINGSVSTYFENLTINNTAGVTLNTVNQHVDEVMSFSAGVLSTLNNWIIINNTNTASLVGYDDSNTKYINGNLRRYVTTGEYELPVGSATNYELATINISSAIGLTYLDVFFTVNNQNPPDPFLTANGARVENFLDEGYWTISPNTGGSATYDLTLRESGHTDLLPTADRYAMLSNLGVGWTDYGTHSPATQIYDPAYVIAKRSGMSIFGLYIIGKTLDDAYVQPVITNELRNEGTKFKIPTSVTVSALGTDAEINNYSGAITTVDGTLVTNGDVNNNGIASFYKVDGTIQLQENWTNDGGVTVTDLDVTYGTVEFNGTAAQTIGGSVVTQFEKLYINNASGVNQNQDVQVDRQLIFAALGGILTTSGYKLINTNTAGINDAVTGYSSTGFVNGTIRQYTIDAGTYYLPCGNATTYELATYEQISNSSMSYIDAHFTEDHTQIPPGGLTVNGQLISEFLDYGYWNLSPQTSGSATYNVIVRSEGHSNGGGTPDLYSVITNTGTGWANLGSHSTGTQSFDGSAIIAKRSALTDFGKYIIGKSLLDSYTQPPITNELRVDGAKFKVPTGVTVTSLGNSAAVNNSNNGIISVDGILSSEADISNDGGGSFIKINGTAKLNGNWTNNGAASLILGDAAAKGTVEFEGTAAQTVGGTTLTEFENLIISNTAGVNLSSNQRIDEQLIFNTSPGLLNTGTNKIIIHNSAGTAFSGYGTTKYVNGTISQEVVAGTYILPLGDATNYEQATIEITSVGTLTAMDVNFTMDGVQTPPPALTVGGQLVTEFLNYGYWNLTCTGSGTYNITVQSGGHSNGGGTPDLYSVVTSTTVPPVSGTSWQDIGSHSSGTQGFDGIYVYAKRSALSDVSASFIIGKAIADAYVQASITNELRNSGAKLKVSSAASISSLGVSAMINNYNSGAISVDGTLISAGSFTNEGVASTVAIDGSVKVATTWTNNGAASLSDGDGTYGTVEFNGSAGQNLTGTTVTQFEKLKMNNATGLTLGINTQVNEELVMTLGDISTDAFRVIINNTSNTSITSYSENSYVNGNLRQYIASGTYPLPIGTVANYELANYEVVTLGASSYIDINFTIDGAQTPPPLLVVGGLLVTEFLNYGYWNLSADNSTGSTFNITTQSGGHTNGGGTPDIYSVLTYKTAGTAWESLGIHSAATQGFNPVSYIYAKRSALADYGKFIIGKADADTYTEIAITNELKNSGAKIKIAAGASMYSLGTNTAINNNADGVITIDGTLGSGTSAVAGAITNSGAGSQFKVDGTLKLSGNFTNNGMASLSDGDGTFGTLNLFGTANQNVGGTAISQIENVTLDNAAGATLTNNIQVDQVFTFGTGGKLTTGANKLIISNNDAVAIAGYSTAKYVIGKVSWNMTNTTYNIPLGTASYYELATIVINSSSGLSYLDFIFNESDENPVTPVGLSVAGGGLGTIDAFLNYGYWNISETGAPTANFDLTIQSGGHYNGGGIAGDYAVLSRIPAGDWGDNGDANNPADQSFVGAYVSAKRAGITAFGDYIIGRGNDYTPYSPLTNEIRIKNSVFKTTGSTNTTVFGPSAKINNYNSGYLISEVNATIISEGDINNNGAGSFIQANGTIQLKGSWNNEGEANLTLGDNTDYGTIEFNGIASQSLGGNINTLFENLKVNNAVGITLSRDQQVDNILTFTSGKITTNANKLIVSNTTPTSIAGGYDANKYVIGNLRRFVGINTYDFPVGTATYYELANIQVTSATDMTYIDAIFTAGNQNPVTPPGLTVQGVIVSEFLDYGYWTLSSDATAINYNVSISSLGHTNGGATADRYAVISRYIPPGTTWADNGTHSVSTQVINGSTITAVRSNLTTLGDFIVAKGASQFYQQIPVTNELRNKNSVYIVSNVTNGSVSGTSAEINNSNSGLFKIETGAVFNANGNINNLTSATIKVEGTINITGIWTNNATASVGDGDGDYGLITFNSSVATQTIDGTTVTQFENFTINNSFGVNLNVNTEVQRTLTFTSGLINTGANRLLVSNSNAVAIVGYGNAKYINGNLRRFVTNNTYDLPVGTATQYELANIQINSNTGLSYVDVNFTAVNPNPVPGGLTVNGVTITNFLDYGYWNINGDGSAINYNLSIQEGGHTDLGGTPDMYALLSKIPTPGTYADLGIHSISTQSFNGSYVIAQRYALTGFGDFVIGKGASMLYQLPAITNELRNKSSVFRITGTTFGGVSGSSAELNNSNTGIFLVENGATFNASGNINNLTSSTITIDGIINITGTWTNNATASLSDGDATYGSVNFVSTTASQTIAGSAITVFENLELNNSFGLTLSLDADISRTLTMTSGKIITGANKAIVSNTATNAILSYDASKYIIGNLRRYVSNATYDLPVGTVAQYELANIQINSNTGLTYIDVAFAAGNQNPVPGGLTVQGVAIVNFLNYGYWNIAGNIGFTAVNYNLGITETGHTDLGGTSDMYALISKIPSTGLYADNGVHSSSTQTYAVNNVYAKRSSLSGFGHYVIGKANSSIYPTYAITNEIRNKGSVIRMTNANTATVSGTLAQINNSNSATIKVENLATLTSKGDINNLTSSTIQIDGTINIEGNWTNNATQSLALAGATKGTVVFNGTTAAQILGGTVSSYFENLTINNANGVSLSVDERVDNIMNMTSGKITTDAFNMIVNNASTAAITNYSETKYIVGNLRRYVGVGTYDLPIGTSAYYELATLKINTITSGLNYVDVHFIQDDAQIPPMGGIAVGTKTINQFMNYGYWYIAPDGAPVGLSYDFTIQSAGQTNVGGIASDYSLITDLRDGSGWISYGTHTDGTQSFSGSYIIAKRTNPTMNAFGNYIVGRAGDPAMPIVTNQLKNLNAVLRITGIENITLVGTSAELTNSGTSQFLIEQDAYVWIKGNVMNNGTSTISIDGTLGVNGDLTNNANGSLIKGGGSMGKIELLGATLQTIKGTATTSFEKLTINNTNVGIRLNSNINVSNELLMTDGDFNLINYNIELGTTGFITGETASNRIKATNAVFSEGLGTGAITYTTNINIGNNNNIAGLGLSIDAFTNFGSTTIERGHLKQQGSGDYTLNYGINRYYKITPTAKTTHFGTFDVNYHSSELNGHSDGTLVLYQWYKPASASAYWKPLSTTNVSPLITATSLTHDLPYIKITAGSTGVPLPIQLLSFTAKTFDNVVLSEWTTVAEINNDFFTLERSKNAINFEEVTRVKGAGNSSSPIKYSAFDNNPYKGVSYYRLKQTDYNGQQSYSYIVSVYIDDTQAPISVSMFPNPADAKTGFYLNCSDFDTNTDAVISISDMLGETVYTSKTVISEKQSIIKISNLTIAPGLYFINVFNGKENYIKKIVIN
ncbi:MAG: hypothetical protein A2275_01300 [Bacteroidetes bacterium RIFOXYA12_FULL_35_11]|nr:MAG: hypothetical protein A2275_01300 [Bacteroidetes bacterium RIFOXYA12_FULL_35_11]